MKRRSQPLLKNVLWAATLGWAVAICLLSSRPADELSSPLLDLPYGDKLAHLIAFAVGGFLLASSFRLSTEWKWGRVLVLSVIGISVFGALDEWHQLYTPGRSGADVFDWLADSAGATLGAFSARPIHGRIRHLFAGSRPHRPLASGD